MLRVLKRYIEFVKENTNLLTLDPGTAKPVDRILSAQSYYRELIAQDLDF